MPAAPAADIAPGSYADSCKSVAPRNAGGSLLRRAALTVAPASLNASTGLRREFVCRIARVIASVALGVGAPSRKSRIP
jgi:hypothetical protein